MLHNIHTEVFLSLHGIIRIHPLLDDVIYIIAEFIDVYVVFIGIMFVIIHRHGHDIHKPILVTRYSLVEGLYTSLGVFIAWGISYLMKIGFAIARPFLQFTDLVPLFVYGGYNSFPSGHATLFAALAVAIYLHHRKVGAIFIFLAFIIALARVIAGIHFPIDILVGWTLGGLSSYTVYYVFTRHMR